MRIALYDLAGVLAHDADIDPPSADGSFPTIVCLHDRVFVFSEKHPRNRSGPAEAAAVFMERRVWEIPA